MKRTRNIVIAVGLIVLILAGSLYAVWRFAGSENQPVKVVPVASVDFSSDYDDFYGYYDDTAEGGIEGTIVSRDSQHVSLESDLELKEVKVKEGDTVKAGDVLLVYDMTMKELEKETADLNVQIKRIYLNKAEKDLEKLKAKYPAVYEATMNSRTRVSDLSVMTEKSTEDGSEKTSEKTSEKSASLEPETNVRTQEGDDLLTFDEDDDPVDSSDSGIIQDEDDGADAPSDQEWIIIDDEPDEPADDSVTPAPSGGSDILDPEEYGDDDILVPDDGDEDILDPEEDAERDSDRDSISILTEFLAAVNMLSRDYFVSRYELDPDDVKDAQEIFEKYIGVERTDPAILDPDAFGDARRTPVYIVSQQTWDLLKRSDSLGYSADEMVMLLEQAYMRVLYFRLITQMNEILPNGKKTTELTDDEVKALGDAIRSAADDYYRAYYYWRFLKEKYEGNELMLAFLEDYEGALMTFSAGKDNKEGIFPGGPGLGGAGDGQLSRLIRRLLDEDEIPSGDDEEEEGLAEPDTEGFGFDDDFGGDYGDEAEEEKDPANEMYEAVTGVIEKELDLRDAELKLKKCEEELKKGTVVAGIDGVVRQAGTLDEGAVMEDFIVIFGGKGLYAVGSVSEFKRDTVSIGDTIKGTTETGIEFTAKITEISDYPNEDSTGYSYYSSEMENTTSSYYPFYAFIEDDEEITEGYATISLDKDKDKAHEIGLEKMFIRQDPNGRSYVYVAGKAGRLEKRYVSTNVSDYIVYVTEGLTSNDLIAFPYGDNVKEGASTTQVASLFGDEDDIYW